MTTFENEGRKAFKEERELRDLFAINIVNGYLSNHQAEFRKDEFLVERAYRIADIMMEMR